VTRQRGLHRGLALGERGYIGLHGQRPLADGWRKRLCLRGQSVLVLIYQHGDGTAPLQLGRTGCADAGGRAGDEHHFALQRVSMRFHQNLLMFRLACLGGKQGRSLWSRCPCTPQISRPTW
jgi:hypothetical protein